MKVFVRKKRRNEINVIPLVDVLIILIFFFLMTMQFRNLNILNLQLPKIETAGKNDSNDHLVVAIDDEGNYFLKNQPVTENELLSAFALAGTVDRTQPVLLIADERTPLKNVTFVMDACRLKGLEKIRLQAR